MFALARCTRAYADCSSGLALTSCWYADSISLGRASAGNDPASAEGSIPGDPMTVVNSLHAPSNSSCACCVISSTSLSCISVCRMSGRDPSRASNRSRAIRTPISASFLKFFGQFRASLCRQCLIESLTDIGPHSVALRLDFPEQSANVLVENLLIQFQLVS